MYRNKKRIQLFDVVNYFILLITSLTCVLPFVHIASVSLSSKIAAESGKVKLWPVDFQLTAYQYVLEKPEFWRAIFVSIERTGLSLLIGMCVIILAAYPLSKDSSKLKGRTFIAWYFFITMLFGGGLIPTYMTIKNLGMLDKIWSLVLPGALDVFKMLLMLNFFRQVPVEIEEAALIDGAGHWRILWQFFVPVSKPAIATIALFITVSNWNAWFDGIIYMNHMERLPLQSFLQIVIINQDLSALSSLSEIEAMMKLSQRTITTAQIFIGALPILLVYPYLQKYFVKGMVIGSVKG